MRMQATAFGARDRRYFGVTLCSAPRRRLNARLLGTILSSADARCTPRHSRTGSIRYWRKWRSMMAHKLQRLLNIGFVSAGQWLLTNTGLEIDLQQYAAAQNVLYAFVVDKQLFYIGKTTQTLNKRMAGYRSPGPSQSTNIKNNTYIQTALQQGKQVEVYVLPDNGLLHYGGFHLNLAAGLEDSLIRDLAPPWNGGQKETKDGSLIPTDAP